MGYEVKRNASGRWVWAHGDELPPATEPRPDGALFTDDNDGKVYISVGGDWNEVGGGGALPVPEFRDTGEVGPITLMIKCAPNVELGNDGNLGITYLYMADFQPLVMAPGGELPAGYYYKMAAGGVNNLGNVQGHADAADCFVTFTGNDLGTQVLGFGIYDDQDTLLTAVEQYCIVQANTWSPGN